MAEGLFRKAVDTISPETADILAKHEASLDGFRSRVVSDYLLDEATHVVAMTKSHLGTLVNAFPDYQEKCYLLGEFIEVNGKTGLDVPDPIGRGPSAYAQVAAVFEHAIPSLLEFVQQD